VTEALLLALVLAMDAFAVALGCKILAEHTGYL
jgi:putative Mn2+ efflux pump MntP